MSQDPVSDVSPSDLPDPVREWLEDLATERDVDEEALLTQLLTTTSSSAADERVTELEDRLASLESRLEEFEANAGETDAGDTEELREAIESLETEIDEKIEDVRERVIQVKRETDGKASTDHEHPELAEQIEGVSRDVDAIADTVEDLEETVEAQADGEAAYREEIEEAVESTTQDVTRKLDMLASAVLDMRDRLSQVSSQQSRRRAVEELQETANRQGIRRGACEACGESIDLTLLTKPRCPHCETGLRDVEPKRRFFGSNTVVTGTPPPLEGQVKVDSDLDEFAEE